MKKEIGKRGEDLATEFLKKKGYKILERNYKFKIPGDLQRGEIDIVAKKGDKISFVEVKLLQNPANLISPEEKVNFAKKRKLIMAAESWLIKNKIPLNSKWQIDIIAITLFENKTKISHFENAISDLF